MKRFATLVMAVAVTLCLQPLFAFDIEKDLFVQGDLHASWKAGPVAPPPQAFKGVPETKRSGDRRLSKRDKVKGGVTALIYDNPDDAAEAYDTVLKGMGKNTTVVDGLGDMARGYYAEDFGFPRAQILFMRGNTVFSLQLSDMMMEELLPYAKKLDARAQQK